MDNVLKFSFLRPRESRCAHCGKGIFLRSSLNEPGYCSYECGVLGQPEHAAVSSRNLYGENN